LILTAAYFVLPDGLAQSVGYNVIGLLTVGAVLAGVRLHRPADKLTWWLFAGQPVLDRRGCRRDGLHVARRRAADPVTVRRSVSRRLSVPVLCFVWATAGIRCTARQFAATAIAGR